MLTNRRAATPFKDVDGKTIHEGDSLLIKDQYTGKVFKQHNRWLVAVETLRFMVPMTIMPVDIAVSIYKAKVNAKEEPLWLVKQESQY